MKNTKTAKRSIKVLSFVLTLLTVVFSLAACATPGDDVTDTTAPGAADGTTAAENTTAVEISRDKTPDNLPDNLNYNNSEVTIIYRDSTNYKLDFVAEKTTGEPINDAVFERNMKVEERLSIKYNLIPGLSDNKQYCNDIKTRTLSGDPGFDIVSAYQAYTVPLALDGCFLDMSNSQYLDFEQPWWAYDYMTEIQVSDKEIFFLQGDIALFMLGSMGAVYFNKVMFENKIDSVDEFYKLVFDGKWTMDKMSEYSKNAYEDKNGNGPDKGDIYGFCATVSKSTEHFMYDAGVRASSRDENGLPYITLKNEKTIEFFDKLYALYFENEGAYIAAADSEINEFVTDFANESYLFFPGWLYMATKLTDMVSEYGIIPFPKLNEEVEEYKSLVHDGTTIYCVAKSCQAPEMISAVLEATCAESYRRVTPAYFDVALKYRYSKDEQSARVLDMLRENVTTDFLYANNYSFTTNIGLLCRTLMQAKAKNFVAMYDRLEKASNTQLAAVITKYKAAAE